MAIVGWSFGGAVIAHAATQVPETVTVLGFAPQALDTEPVAKFHDQSILLVHSLVDENVPYVSSEQILDETPDEVRRRLVTLEGADHQLTGQGSTLDPIVREWLSGELLSGPPCGVQ